MRTLNRPMFRSGGSTGEGITSGLAPRQGYAIGGLSDEDIAEIRKQSRELTQGNRKADMNQFLIDFGLNMVSGTPKGNIFATAAESAKGPMATMQKSRMSRGAAESDMFATLFKGAIDSTTGGKSYAHRDKASMVDENMDKQYAIIDQLNALDTSAEDYSEQKQSLTRALRKLKEQVSGDEFAKAQLQYWNQDQNSRKLDELIRLEIAKQLEVDPGTDFAENKDFAEAFIKRRNEIMNNIRLGISPTFNFAEGGRAGYQQGMSVMPTAMPAQEETMPEELGKVSYDELRARLPQEVSDEVVQLLANSAEALEDFATIQTEQDIANFNKKYGVNLVLPAEG